jgi:outer membrane murein-binding lipoprotein Lpp
MRKTYSFVVAALAASLVLAGCSSGPKGVRVTNGGTSAFSAKEGEKIRNLSASEIQARIVGKTFQYTRKDGNGFVTYNADGSFDYQDDTRGEGRGRWIASGEQYCEVFGAGAPQECGIFKTTGDAYFAANSRLVEMQI